MFMNGAKGVNYNLILKNVNFLAFRVRKVVGKCTIKWLMLHLTT